MMWTIAPAESWQEADQSAQTEEIVCHHGIFLSAVRDNAGGYRVNRLLSTDPNDYLSAELAPGKLIIR